jgi:hypothetical protein
MEPLRVALRLATLLLLGAAAVSLAALSGEYPGASAAGRHVATRELLPLALLAWAHLVALDTQGRVALRRWAAVAALGDAALLASGLTQAWRGGAPLTVALPVIAALLMAGTIALAWRGRSARASTASRSAPARNERPG